MCIKPSIHAYIQAYRLKKIEILLSNRWKHQLGTDFILFLSVWLRERTLYVLISKGKYKTGVYNSNSNQDSGIPKKQLCKLQYGEREGRNTIHLTMLTTATKKIFSVELEGWQPPWLILSFYYLSFPDRRSWAIIPADRLLDVLHQNLQQPLAFKRPSNIFGQSM